MNASRNSGVQKNSVTGSAADNRRLGSLTTKATELERHTIIPTFHLAPLRVTAPELGSGKDQRAAHHELKYQQHHPPREREPQLNIAKRAPEQSPGQQREISARTSLGCNEKDENENEIAGKNTTAAAAARPRGGARHEVRGRGKKGRGGRYLGGGGGSRRRRRPRLGDAAGGRRAEESERRW